MRNSGQFYLSFFCSVSASARQSVPAHKFLCRGRAAHAREAERGARAWRGPAEVGGARGSALLEVPAGGLPPAVGGEGGCPRLILIPGRVLIYVTASDRTLGLVSGAAGAASFFFEWPRVWGAGGACCGRGGGRLPPPGFWCVLDAGRVRFYVTNECQPPEYDFWARSLLRRFLQRGHRIRGRVGRPSRRRRGRRSSGRARRPGEAAGGGRGGGRGGWRRVRASGRRRGWQAQARVGIGRGAEPGAARGLGQM